jgi:hypothetical protein
LTGDLVTIRFSGGRQGQEEAGIWEFWTVFKKENGVVSKYFARCRQGRDPGERFRRMEGQKEYEKEYGEAWSVASAADGIRPATKAEVELWLNTHKVDAQFADSCQLGDKVLSVAKTAEGFIIKKKGTG